jgi:hypothetical protein
MEESALKVAHMLTFSDHVGLGQVLCSSSGTGWSQANKLVNPFAALPPELVFHIFSFLCHKDTLRLTETSRVCYYFANDGMVWKNLIHTELGVTFLGGSELIFDKYVRKSIKPNNMEVEEGGNGITWKERFQYLLSIKADLIPVYSRKPSARSAQAPAESKCSCRTCDERCTASPLGCKHYKRDCKLFAACCGRFFVCRHCHDENIQGHHINRYATQLVLCMRCLSIQPVDQNCASSRCKHKTMGGYFCGVCKFYDNDRDKAIFHCEFCHVCKLGRKAESFHCHICGRCFSKAVMATHPCLTRHYQTLSDER